MKTQLKRVAFVVGLAMVAGVAFLTGQMSAPSPASAQATQPCVVAATHTGQWKEDQIIWSDMNRPAVVTVTNPSGASVSLYADGRYRTIKGGSTVIGREISTATAGGAGGTYMITTTVPCP